MSSAYVDLDYVKLVGAMTPTDIDDLEAVYPGTFAQMASSISRIADSRCHKKYETPFKTPYPEAIRFHVAQLVAYQLFIKRGFNPGSAQDELISRAKDEAWAYFKDAADGLVELPIREADPAEAQAAKRGGPQSYTEVSPYTWTDLVRDRLKAGKR